MINDILIKIWKKYTREKKGGEKSQKLKEGTPLTRFSKKELNFFSPHFYLVLKGGIFNQLCNFLDRL